MEAVAIELDAISAISGTSTAPFGEVYVTLTKLEHIGLVMEARRWKSLHQRALGRLQQLQDGIKRFVDELRGKRSANPPLRVQPIEAAMRLCRGLSGSGGVVQGRLGRLRRAPVVR